MSFLSISVYQTYALPPRGVMATAMDQLTTDGYDMQFGVNVLGPYHTLFESGP